MPIRFLTSGESHGPAVTAILEGMPAGLKISKEIIDHELSRRQKGYGSGPRMKIEKDTVRIVGGLMAGKTIGSPISILIENRDHEKWQGVPIPPFTIPRPGHADLSGAIKYGYEDLRLSLERASARETVARVAVGAVCRHFLAQFGIQIGGYVVSIGEVDANVEGISLENRAKNAGKSEVRCPNPDTEHLLRNRIEEIIKARDTLGGQVEVFALGVPAGLGSHVHWDRKLDSRLGAAVLSVPAIKGVEIGPAFKNSRLAGTQVQDPIRLNGIKLSRTTNNAGGLEGGVTNGSPLILRVAMKPIATTLTPQRSVDLHTRQETETQYERSDFCPVPRVVPIIEAVVAIVLADALIEKIGGDSISEMKFRFQALRGANISDLPMDNENRIWWPS